MKIDNIEHANIILRNYAGLVKQYSGDNQSLGRIWPMLSLVGDPHKDLRVVHVAGTSGKTSTCYYLSSLIGSSGLKVGLTVSPHVYSVTERIQINNLNISDEKFCDYLGRFIDKISALEHKPSYFELMIVLALWVFREEKVDYVVLETGMGGLLDGSNVVTNKNKICVITDIGLDHVQILGNTVSEIAEQKAGIIHESNNVFMYDQSKDVMDKVYLRAKQKDAKVNVVKYALKDDKSADLPEFQRRNWNLAVQVSKYIAELDEIKIDLSIDPNLIFVPGRMQTTKLEDQSTLIIDGAHNEQKIKAFVSSFSEKYPGQAAVIMLSLKEGKEYKEVIDALLSITEFFILTKFNTSQDLPAVSQDPNILRDYAKSVGIESQIIDDPAQAFLSLKAKPYPYKIVVGSFYLISQINN